MTVLDALVTFVNKELIRPPAAMSVTADTPLFEHGLINSLNVLQLIAFVEARQGSVIPDRDLVMDRFRTPRTIVESFLS